MIGTGRNLGLIKIKLPSFQGKSDHVHFFIKLGNYFDTNGIRNDRDSKYILISCLSEDALDLFNSLEEERQFQAYEARFGGNREDP